MVLDAHAEGVLLAICGAVPGSSRRGPSVAFNNGMFLRAKRCGAGAGAKSQTWRRVVCVLPLVEGRAQRGGGPIYQFPTDPFGQLAGAHRGSF